MALLATPPLPAPVRDVTPRWELTGSSVEAVDAGGSVHLPGPGAWLLVLGGELLVESWGAAHTLRTGDAVYLRRAHAHRVVAALHSRLVVVSLHDAGAGTGPPDAFVVRDFGPVNRGIAALLELCPVTTAWNLAHFGKSYGELIAAAMHKHWLESRGEPADPPVLAPEVARVVTAVLRDPAHPWTLEGLAGLAHLSRSSLGERFRATLGLSPLQFVREARMRVARELLSDPDRSVTQVAFAVGYGSVAAFSRAFTSVHGMTPRCWRAGSRPDGAAEEREPGGAHESKTRAGEQHRGQARGVEQLPA
jgi:AraC-like DNA-binding protein